MKRQSRQGLYAEIQRQEEKLKSQGFHRVQKRETELLHFEYTLTNAHGSETSFEGQTVYTIYWAMPCR